MTSFELIPSLITVLKLRDCFFLTGPKTKKNGNYEFGKVIDENEDDDESDRED